MASTRAYRDTAYGWALQDTASFAKILADPGTRLLLGAQVASGVLYIHPALSEVVQQALLDL